MDVRPGYKLTELGSVPEEWGNRSLGAICDVRDGTHESPRFFSDGVPFVTSKNIVNGRLDLENVSYISKSDAIEFDKRSKVDRNDILLSMIGTIGSAVLVECEPDFCIKNVALLKPRYVLPAFLIQLINSPIFQEYLGDNLDGGIQKFISLGTLRQLSITLPDEPEQRAIAAALSDMDALLGGLDRLIAKKRDLKQAAMQQLLTGQTRLPGFHGEWEVKRLGEISEISMGRTPPRLNQAFWGRGYTWLSIADLQSKVVSDSKEEITALAASTMTIIPKGTLLMSFKLSIGRLCFAGRDLFTNEAICGFNKLQANSEFLYYALSRTDFSLYGKQAVKGYTLNKESLKIVEVRLPSPAEQTAIAAVLSDMDAELAALEARRDKTRNLKQAMMQELLTGKTRLVPPGGAHA